MTKLDNSEGDVNLSPLPYLLISTVGLYFELLKVA